MKKYDISELRRKAATYFKSNPEAKEFFVTEDGMFFTNESLAKDHNKKQVKGELHKITQTAVLAQEAIDEKAKEKANELSNGEQVSGSAPTPDDKQSEESASEGEEGGSPAPASEDTAPGEPAAEPTQLDLEQLQDEYERVTGNKPGNRKAETLQKEIDEALKETK